MFRNVNNNGVKQDLQNDLDKLVKFLMVSEMADVIIIKFWEM